MSIDKDKTNIINTNNKYKKNNLNQSKKTNNNGLLYKLRIILIVLLSTVVFYPSFVKGLYFETDAIPTEIYVYLIFILFWIYKKLKNDRRFLETPIDAAVFGFVIVYFLSLFTSVEIRQAIIGWSKYCMYFAIYFMLSELFHLYKSKLALLWIMVISATGISLLGIDGAAGEKIANVCNNIFNALKLNVKFFSLFSEGRITSTIQYANALAALLMTSFIILLGLLIVAPKLRVKAAAGAMGFLQLLALFFTLSRGVYLVFVAVIILYIFVLPRGSKIKGAVYFIALAVSTAVVSLKFSVFIQNGTENTIKIWLTILIGVVISATLTVLAYFIIAFFERLSWKVYAAAISCIVILLGIGLIYVLGSKVPLVLEHSGQKTDEQLVVQKRALLKPGREYKLVFDVNAVNNSNISESYDIAIDNNTEKDLLFFRSSNIETYNGSATKGMEKKDINFKVPDDSNNIEISFKNGYKDSKVTFYDAKIVDAASGNTVNNIALKYKYIPDDIASRLEDMLSTRNAIERGIFYKDALKVYKDHWFMGAGAGAWADLYFAHQSYLYNTQEDHNYLLAVAIESGILGLIVFAFLLIAILINAIRELTIKQIDENIFERIIQLTLFTAICALFIHSMIDFDLSFPAIMLLLWSLIALFNARYKNVDNSDKVESKYLLINNFYTKLKHYTTSKIKGINPKGALVASTAILVMLISFQIGITYAARAASEAKIGNYNATLSSLKAAVFFDPTNAENKLQYAEVLRDNKQASVDDSEMIKSNYQSAEALSKYVVQDLPAVAENYYKDKDYDKVVSIADRLIALKPFDPEMWETRVDLYTRVILNYFVAKDNSNADALMDKALNIVNEAKTANKANMNPFIFTAKTDEEIERLKFIKDNAAKLKTINYNDIAFYNMPDMDIDSNNIPDQWQSENPNTVNISYDNNIMLVKNMNAGNIEFIKSREITLNPNETYTIEVELNNMGAITQIPYTLTGISEKNNGLKLNGGVYSDKIITPSNTDGKTILRLGIEGKLDIKGISIVGG